MISGVEQGRRKWFFRVLTVLLLVVPTSLAAVFFRELWWNVRVALLVFLGVAVFGVFMAGIYFSYEFGELLGRWLGRSAGWNEDNLEEVFSGLALVLYLVLSALLLFTTSVPTMFWLREALAQ
jgi:hypothetical protein